MLRWRPVVLIAAPVVLLAASALHSRWQLHAARDGLTPVESIRWHIDGRPATIAVDRDMSADLERFEINVLVDDAVHQKLEFEIDHDMYGGGFIGGLDIDDDGDTELVLATRAGAAASRLVEPGGSGIVDRRFDELPPERWQRIEPRVALAAPSPYALGGAAVGGLWLLAGIVVYVIIALAWVIRRARPPRGGSPDR